MTSVRSLFGTFVEGLAEQLAGYGFERARGARVFRRFSRDGDVFVVELQSSAYSTRTEKAFYINVALVLAPHWQSRRRRLGLPGSELPRSLHGIWSHRIGFTTLSGGDQWRITDRATLAKVSEHVRRRVDEALPELLQMLDRDTLFVDAAELFRGGAWRVRAWLLAEKGPSEELERLLSAGEPAAVRMIRDYVANSYEPAPGELLRARPRSHHESGSRGVHSQGAPDAERAVQGRVAEDNIVQLLRRISGYVGYAYDDLDEAALTGALDDTSDESADAWFRYPLMGMPPLTVQLARSPGGTAVSVRVEGAMAQILATRMETLLDLL
ncbi:DUF4304 domain-containing protein [Plantactinospora solaniradicis]|uniref:DUF4304 domain-containing protein n=1 Tax=Plantactinospora solaniradicis TaxID=1723736 RepID=A0ABW1KB00_9ACTN